MVKIFVGRLTENVQKSELEELFKGFGEVTDCSVLKNYGFVHMANLDEAKAAIAGLDKHELHGNPINVELSTTKVAKASKLFVGNLPPDTKSSEIHKLFKQHGTVIECDVVKNFAFVHMGKEAMAREAIEALNDTDFNGNKITVQMARAKRQDHGAFDSPHQPFMFPGADHLAPFRGRGRGFYAMPPMRGLPRFRGRPFGPDPFLDQSMRRGGLRPRLPGAAGIGAMYGRDLLAQGLAPREMMLGAGDPFLLREREALTRRLDADTSLDTLSSNLGAAYGYQATGFSGGLDRYSAY